MASRENRHLAVLSCLLPVEGSLQDSCEACQKCTHQPETRRTFDSPSLSLSLFPSAGRFFR